MGLIAWIKDKFTNNMDENSPAFRREMAARLHNRSIKYCSERQGDTDIVVGRAGSITVRDDEILILSSFQVVFRGKVEETSMSELMSLEGVIFSGPDYDRGGEERTVIAYYTYYRK
ncbi:MAG: hypothetical protein E7599_06075 [Ruminococcaceae bacterium]|nr:hypothetical protein [Oscillospiraceae bacterium]